MQLSWNKCQDSNWCRLPTVDLNDAHFDNMDGVYIIWRSGNNPATVRVGQGNIRERLQVHRTDQQVMKFKELGLFVTWAAVEKVNRDGIEAFLANQIEPIVGIRFPDRRPITVNLPW
jgi:hypothetical protein